jgi:hypothetical protein
MMSWTHRRAARRAVGTAQAPTVDGTSITEATQGAVALRLTIGRQRICALFAATTLRVDEPGRLRARGARAESLPDLHRCELARLLSCGLSTEQESAREASEDSGSARRGGLVADDNVVSYVARVRLLSVVAITLGS